MKFLLCISRCTTNFYTLVTAILRRIIPEIFYEEPSSYLRKTYVRLIVVTKTCIMTIAFSFLILVLCKIFPSHFLSTIISIFLSCVYLFTNIIILIIICRQKNKK